MSSISIMMFLFFRKKFNFRTKSRSKIFVFVFLFYDFLVFVFFAIVSKVFHFSRFKVFRNRFFVQNNHMIVFCILRQVQFKKFVFVLIDFEISTYVFIDKIFAQFHDLLLHFFAYFRRFRKFDNQIVRIENITHVIYIIMILKTHVKRLFLYVIDFNQYFIIMNFFWFRRHEIHVSFEFNTLIMFSIFVCFIVAQFLSRFKKSFEKKKFLISQKFQRIWKFENQKKKSLTLISTFRLFIKKHFVRLFTKNISTSFVQSFEKNILTFFAQSFKKNISTFLVQSFKKNILTFY